MSSFGGHNTGASNRGVLDECSSIDNGINQVEHNLEKLRSMHQRSLDDADSSSASASNRQLDSLSADTMSLYRELTQRVRELKSKPSQQIAQYRGQVDRVDRRLKSAIQQYQEIESQFRKRTQDQMARQYRIVRPDASEQEVRAAVNDTSNTQVFSQAMLQSDRQGRARAALSAVEDRHAALLKIEQQMAELSQLFMDMDALVVQQEDAVVNIEQKGEQVVTDLEGGNTEIATAVKTARSTRKKKWICLGICVTIIIIVVIVVLIYVFVIRGNNNSGNKKRALLEGISTVAARGIMGSGAGQLESRAIDQGAASAIARLAKERFMVPHSVVN